MIKTQLVDRRNVDDLLPEICKLISGAALVGIDCETQDDARHEGLNILMKVDEESREKSKTSRLIFDHRRTVMTGFSVYPENHDTAYYFNLAHADVENRLAWDEVRCVMDAKSSDAWWISHNAPFELTMFKQCHDYDLTNVICTMQLSVTAFGDDNYDLNEFAGTGLDGLAKWPFALMRAAASRDPLDLLDEESERSFGREADDIIGKITSKTSTASHSYNGYVKALAFGHGLKQLVWKMFHQKMGTFEETLAENAHMGQLTGEQVADYGAEDAFWVVPLFHELMARIARDSPDALETFFSQENPMIHVYSELWREGMRVRDEAIARQREVERRNFANTLRSLRAVVREMQFGPVKAELVKRESWYAKNADRYRKLIKDWADLDDEEDDYEECIRVSNAVPNAWAEERGDKRRGPLSITHYMPARVLLYDLIGAKLQFDMGKLASNGEARGKIKDTLTDPLHIQAVECMTELASIEQRMKLYLTPYTLMTDPETHRLYPTVNSLLNSRRLAASQPNPMQLAKRGESTYVRGFFLGDTDEHLIVSLDWSAIELVIIGELSKDPEFFKAFGQTPHQDLHTGATSAVLSVEMPWITDEHIHSLRRFQNTSDYMDHFNLDPKDCARLFTNLKGEAMTDPAKIRSYWRTEVGKGANFNYWFSGFLTMVGQRLGWNLQKTGTATELYRNRFPVAEEWRIEQIDHLRTYGWLQLPDGHRRFRYEATYEWMDRFKEKWPRDQVLDPMVHEIARRIQKRAQNQGVNSVVQGTCATIMKRSILRMRDHGFNARFMIPIHDEMVFSVHYSQVAEFIEYCRKIMTSHDDIFPTLKLDVSPAVGVTFEPWHATKAPKGQIELMEPPAEIVGEARAGKPLDAAGIREVVEYLRAA